MKNTIIIIKPTAFKSSFLIVFLCTFLGFNAHLQAQMGGGESLGVVSGSIIDSISGEALSYVSVALQHARFNKVLNGASTDDKGRFRIEGLAAGQYRLRISMVGYNEKTITGIIIKEDQAIYQTGLIKISSGHNLEEVEIVGKRALIEQHFDKLVYNVGEDIGAGNQSLNDLLRKVPMVTVDANGNVSLRGNSNFQLLIDGKPSGVFAANKTDALRAIPADQVERIEVITMPSARYDMEGAAGVINIITKHKKIKGYNASINVSGGNYINMLNSNLNARGEIFGARLQVGGNKISPQKIEMLSKRIDKTSLSQTTLTQEGAAHFARSSMNLLLGIDFDPSAFHSFSSTLKYSPSSSNYGSNIEVSLASQLEHFFTKDQISHTDQNDETYLWTTDYRKKFDNPNNQWDASVQLATYKKQNDYGVNGYINNLMAMSELAYNKGLTKELTLQTDYVHEFSKQLKIETGGKYIDRNINSGSDFQELIPDEDIYIHANNRSFNLNYEQQIVAAYMESDWQLKENWNFRLGGRVEFTKNHISVENAENIPGQYYNISPTLAVNYIKNATNFTLSYGRRITRPSLSYLNPFENRMDPLNWRQGNPHLRPELVDAIDFNFSKPFKNGFINGNLFYHYTQDIIERNTILQAENRTLSSYLNIGDNHNWGVNAYFSYNFTDNINLKGGSMANYYLSGQNNAPGTQTNKGLSFTLFGLLSWQLKHGFTLETVYAHLGPSFSAQGQSPSFTTYQATLKKAVLKDKGAITLVVVNPFTPTINFGSVLETPEVYQIDNAAVPLRMITIGFNYQFNKNMPMGNTDDKKSIKNNDLKQAEKSKY